MTPYQLHFFSIFLVILVLSGVPNAAEVNGIKFKAFNTVTIGGGAIFTINNTSPIGCAGACASESLCQMAKHIKETQTCLLFHQSSLTVRYPLVDGPSNDTVLISRPISIFHMRHGQGRYRYNFADAQAACVGIGANLATYNQMEEAYNAGSLHVGSCCFITNSKSYYVLQYKVPGVGYAGINYCSWATNANAFCTYQGLQ